MYHFQLNFVRRENTYFHAVCKNKKNLLILTRFACISELQAAQEYKNLMHKCHYKTPLNLHLNCRRDIHACIFRVFLGIFLTADRDRIRRIFSELSPTKYLTRVHDLYKLISQLRNIFIYLNTIHT